MLTSPCCAILSHHIPSSLVLLSLFSTISIWDWITRWSVSMHIAQSPSDSQCNSNQWKYAAARFHLLVSSRSHPCLQTTFHFHLHTHVSYFFLQSLPSVPQTSPTTSLVQKFWNNEMKPIVTFMNVLPVSFCIIGHQHFLLTCDLLWQVMKLLLNVVLLSGQPRHLPVVPAPSAAVAAPPLCQHSPEDTPEAVVLCSLTLRLAMGSRWVASQWITTVPRLMME